MYVGYVPPGSLIPRLTAICFHPSLLPRYRGGSAIAWQLIRGETRTGVTVFWPDAGIDTGGATDRDSLIDLLLDAFAREFRPTEPVTLLIKGMCRDTFYRGQTADGLIDAVVKLVREEAAPRGETAAAPLA